MAWRLLLSPDIHIFTITVLFVNVKIIFTYSFVQLFFQIFLSRENETVDHSKTQTCGLLL